MYLIPPNEHLIETKTCKYCSTSFPITDKDMEFYEKISPIFTGKKYSIPTPTLCPECREQRRLSFRNIRKLYKRKCDITGIDIVSIYSPENIIPVYSHEFWWSDKWDPMDYGRDFDFSRPFFEQFQELMMQVPLCPVSAEYTLQENCEYSNSAGPGKNYYMTFEVAFSENIFYSYSIWQSKNLVDCSYCTKTEDCYSCTDCTNCFNSAYLSQCDDCSDSNKLYNCKNCQFCSNCYGLENKKYHLNNIDYGTLENYQNAINTIGFLDLEIGYLPNGKFINNENTQGRNVTHSKNSFHIEDSSDVTNCKYCSNIFAAQDCYDYYSWGENVKLCYEIQQSGRNISSSSFLWLCGMNGDHNLYSFHCILGISHLFGCIGLRNKSYCILNKQYTKQEYNELVPQIIEHMMKTGEWGEFFPSSISPFGYNETVAQEYFPLVKSEATKDGIFNWSDYEAPFPKVNKTIPAKLLPDTIDSIPDDILNWAIECEVTGRPFRIIKQELEFYRKHNISIPHHHPDQRHLSRMKMRKLDK